MKGSQMLVKSRKGALVELIGWAGGAVLLLLLLAVANLRDSSVSESVAVGAEKAAIPEKAAAAQSSQMAWPLGRGNALATGVALTALTDKPEVAWKITIENGAFEGTPVVQDGVVYLGDMDGNVYAW